MKLKNFVGLIASLLTIFFIIVLGVGFFCGASYEHAQLVVCIGYRTFFGLAAPEEVWFVLMAINLLILPSVFTIPMQEIIFNCWKRFMIWGAPIVIILSALLWFSFDHSGGGLDVTLDYSPLFIHVPIVFLFSWYLLTSTAIIFYARNKDRLGLEIRLNKPIIATLGIFAVIILCYWLFLIYHFDFVYFN